MKPVIRAMQVADIDAVLRLERQVAEAPHWSRAAYEACVPGDARQIADRIALLAERESAVAGLIVVRKAGDTCELESIVVAPGCRRQGVGIALLASALDWAARSHALRIELEVRASNLAALSFYGRAGFREDGRRPGYYRDPPDDAVLMGRGIMAD